MGFYGNDGTYHAFRSVLALPLLDFREASSGDVSNVAGTLALAVLLSDTTPALSGTGSTVSQQLSWVTGNTDQILIQRPLPEDFDGKQDVVIELLVSSGTTDAATFTCLTSWDGSTDVSTTVTDGAKSATTHKISAVIPAASIPDNASAVSVALTPAAHTTNAIVLVSARLLYLPKRVS